MNPPGVSPRWWSLVLTLLTALAGPAARADWEVVGADWFTSDAAAYPSLAFNNGEPYVTYLDVANADKGTVMRYTRGNW